MTPPNVLPLRDTPGQEQLSPVDILMGGASPAVIEQQTGPQKIEQDDGGVIIDFAPQRKAKGNSDKFNTNLAELLDDTELSKIAAEVLDGIENDNQSRQEWLTTLADGMDLLGLKIEKTSTSTGTSTAPLEGMSRVKHPILLEAVLLFTANAFGEILPASGPVKVVDDQASKPLEIQELENPPEQPDPQLPPQGGEQAPLPDAAPVTAPPGAQGVEGELPGSPMPLAPPPGPANGGGLPATFGQQDQPPEQQMPFWAQAMMPQEPITFSRDELADALEKDLNHYLTKVAEEYYPDTDQMNFNLGFSGLGIKKVYNCPIRRRPVSESVKIEDFIVNNALTDLRNASRITHQIMMRPSLLKRMQILGVYRDVQLQEPTENDQENPVTQKKAQTVGVQSQNQDPKDMDHRVYECYCELDLDQFAPTKFKGKGLRLPYRVTLEKQSQAVLEIRRNWKEDDEQCLAREFFVPFPFVRAFGFYGIGLLQILGNTAQTLTAAWRELIHSGMFANFPGFLYAKGAGRQLTNQFRVPPGGGIGLDVGLAKLSDAVMPLPYKDLGPAFTAFITHVEELAQRLGGTSQVNVGEGRQDAPVGTTLALIEQATKPTGAVMKRLHGAQAKEFQLLKERFRDDPEAMWRFNKKPTVQWAKELFLQALDDFDIQPVSDPNNPTRLHRAAKGQAMQALVSAAPRYFDIKKAITKVGKSYGIDDIEEIQIDPPPNDQQIDPIKMGELKIKEGQLQVSQAKLGMEQKTKIGQQAMETQRQELENAQQMREIEGRQEIERLKAETARMNLAATIAQHMETLDSNERIAMINVIKELHKQDRDQGHALETLGQQSVDKHVDRAHTMHESEADRQFQAEQADRDRVHQEQQADRDREHQLKVAKEKPKPAPKSKGK